MFLALAAYFSIFVSASSLLVISKNGATSLLLYHTCVFAGVCAYMASKGELLGWCVIAHPTPFNSFVLPFILWLFYYLLTCAAPLLIVAAPMEFGPELFSSLIIWNGLANGIMIWAGLNSLEGHPFLNIVNGMVAYSGMLLLLAIGLAIFFRNMKEDFETSVFWRRKSGKEMIRDLWLDKKIWDKCSRSKDDERWSWVGSIQPTYLPFDVILPWLCEDLVVKYENKKAKRPDWMDNDRFLKRIVTIFKWKGKHKKAVNQALLKLLGKSAADLKVKKNGRLSFLNKSRKGSKIIPEDRVVAEVRCSVGQNKNSTILQ